MAIANGFMIYELLYHRHWCVTDSNSAVLLAHFRYNTLPGVVNVMCNPVLVRQNVLRQLYINYDPLIDVILRDCELLAQHAINMPDLGYKLLLDQKRVRLAHERLKVIRRCTERQPIDCACDFRHC